MLRHDLLCRDWVPKPSARPDLGACRRHARAIGMRAGQHNACMTNLFGSVLQQGSLCHDIVPMHAGGFGFRRRLSLSR